jgi:hypothetical protein
MSCLSTLREVETHTCSVLFSNLILYLCSTVAHTTIPKILWRTRRLCPLGFSTNFQKGPETRTPAARLLGWLLDALIFSAKFVFWLIEE